MHFPEFDPADFRYYVHQLESAGEDVPALFGVSQVTLRRWMAGKQRVPASAWHLVYVLATGRLDTWSPAWHGWCVENGQLVNGNLVYKVAQIESYRWWEMAYWRNHNELMQMRRTKVPLASEPGRLVNEARAALEAVRVAADTAHQVLTDCLEQPARAPASTRAVG